MLSTNNGYRSLLIAVLSVPLWAPLAFGQITNVTNNTSTPIPGAGHDYIKMLSETVNPANGSVSLRLNVPVPPGRGLTVPFSFDYDSNGIVTPSSSGNGWLVWSWTNSYLYSGGWSYPIPQISHVQLERDTPPGIVPPQSCTYDTGFMFTDPTGGRHALGLAFIEGDSAYCSSLLILPISDSANAWPIPDPAYQASMSAVNYWPLRVADPDGTTYTWQPTGNGSSVPLTIEDRNGNTVVVTDNGSGNFSETDTLGRTVIASSGFGGSGQTDTLSVSGLSDYHVTWSNNPVPASYSVSSQIVGTNTGCGVSGGVSNVSWPVITAIELPNGQEYSFEYDSTTPGATTYGLLNKIIYPSGGYVRYEWALSSYQSQTLSDPAVFANVYGQANTCSAIYDSPAVLNRYVSFDGNPNHEVLQQNFKYTTQWETGNPGVWGSKNTLVTTTVKAVINGGLTTLGSYTTSYTYGSDTAPIQPYDYQYMMAANLIPVEDQVEYCNWGATTCSDTNSIRTVHKRWIDPYRMLGEQVVDNGTVTSDQWFNYGPGAQITDKYECSSSQTCYNAPQGTPPTSYARHTHTDYHTFGNTTNYPSEPSILDRPDSVTVYDGSGNSVAETGYEYDGHGNATSKTQNCLGTCGSDPADPLTLYSYNPGGQLHTVTDPNGILAASYTYECSGTYVSRIDYPLNQYETFTHDCASGRPTGTTDRNRQPTGYTYDNLGRLHTITYPDPGNVANVTYDYGTSSCGTPSTTTTLIEGTTNLTTSATMDGLCQVTQTAITDPQTPSVPVKTDTTYDGMGRVWTVSNPYRSTGDSSYGVTTYNYDPLGRTLSVTNPDSTASTTTYAGLTTTVTDAAQKTRTLTSDMLGHLISVNEAGLYTTSYSYNALDDLTSVTQGSQLPCSGASRRFGYNALSRLTSACNPESGSLAYTYDANGNVMSKTDARGATSFAYDDLNRVLYKNYSDTSTVRGCYAYDGAGWAGSGDSFTNAVGHMTASWSVQHDGKVVAANELYNFDPMGRLLEGRQCTPGNCGAGSYPFTASYDKMGHELSLAESSVTRSSTYDSAARLHTFAANLPGLGNQALLTVTDYDPVGIHIATVGSGSGALTETRTYNNRTWLGSLTVGSVYSLGLTYAGNGNVLTADDNVNNIQSTPWNYEYDNVNRLQRAYTSGQNLIYSYTADGSSGQYGNMTCTNTVYGGKPCTPPDLSLSAANNRITTTGFNYDAAGNLLSDRTHQYHYNAENQIDCVDTDLNGNCTPNSTYYFYDAQGQRVGKQQANTLEDYVYDPQGHVVSVHDGLTNLLRAELYTGGRHTATWNASGPYAGLTFNISDWLGTERVRITPVGNQLCTDTPYGMNLACTDTSADPSAMHFTGKQRDYESGLDNFGARYFGGGNNLGRFMTADPFNPIALKPRKFQAWISNPQRWNKYAYALNNPVSMIDPDGMNACGTKSDADCNVTVTFQDRTKDKKGNYNDQFTKVTNQGQYNATATVSVNGKVVGTFLAKTTPSDSDNYPTIQNGTYSATLTTHNGEVAIRLQPTQHIPIINDSNPATGKPDASGILVHIAAGGNLTGMVHSLRTGEIVPTSAGCQLICTSQYTDFISATGMYNRYGTPGSPAQQHFNVVVDTEENDPDEN